MKVELEKTFPMPAAPEAAWAFLQDIEGVAGCMPGARITERIDATHFKGTVSVKVGPASMSFKGDIEVRELDAGQRMLHLVGKGSDTSGSSGASMDLVARIEPNTADGLSQLVGRSEVTMSGKAAAFGGRMMGTVADQILKQFAGNFAARVQARAASEAAAAASATTASTADATAPAGAHTTAGTTDTSVEAARRLQPPTLQPAAVAMAAGAQPALQSAAVAVAAGAQPALQSAAVAVPAGAQPALQPAAVAAGPEPTQQPRAVQAVPPAAAPATELNALALLWAIIRDWFRGLFRRRPA